MQAEFPFVVVGHVDHGKSTLVGRLLIDTGSIQQDRLQAVKQLCARNGKVFEASYILDALMEEQAQSITIDTTQAQIKGAQRNYRIIDAPGHREFLKNMVSGAAKAHAAVLVVDAKEGVCRESRTHSMLLSFLGIKRVVVAVNKLDLLDYAEASYQAICDELRELFVHLQIEADAFIPLSAFYGENVVHRQDPRLDWYQGPSLMSYLESIEAQPGSTDQPLRFEVQDVYKFDERRIIAGRLQAGSLRVGDTLAWSPSGKLARVASIEAWNPKSSSILQEAHAGQSIGLTIEERLFIDRGQIASTPEAKPHTQNQFSATIFWMGQQPLRTQLPYKLRLATQEVDATILHIEESMDMESLDYAVEDRSAPQDVTLKQYQVGKVFIKTALPLSFDLFSESEAMGRFVLIDAYRIAGSGIITKAPAYEAAREVLTSSRQRDVFWEWGPITPYERSLRFGHQSCVLWLTGLPASGKSTIGNALARVLFARQIQCFRLDGDNVRHGLCNDLGFSEEDRLENIRRAAEAAKLLAESGQIVIASFISPDEPSRAIARGIIGEGQFIEIHIDCPVEVCEERDPKGLYRKARAGQISQFTGVQGAYASPLHPDLVLKTAEVGVEAAVAAVLELLQGRQIIGEAPLAETPKVQIRSAHPADALDLF